MKIFNLALITLFSSSVLLANNNVEKNDDENVASPGLVAYSASYSLSYKDEPNYITQTKSNTQNQSSQHPSTARIKFRQPLSIGGPHSHPTRPVNISTKIPYPARLDHNGQLMFPRSPSVSWNVPPVE